MTSLIITTDGFEDSELTYPYYRLQEADVEVDIATPDAESVTGKIGEEMDADLAVSDADPEEYDHLVLPGGHAPENLRLEAPEAADIVAAFDEAGEPISSICHGAQLLISADVLDGRDATGYQSLAVDIENAGATFRDEAVVVDDNLVTSRGPQDLPAFMAETLAALDAGAEAEAPAAE